MTPLTLQLQYFGPYRDATVDFTKFTTTPLFLISGKTGSGKTTIFDGMCYALFDQTSGTDREPKAMRSDFATFDDLTRVTFTFSHRDKRYEIIREPTQTLNKKRGTGVRTVTSSATLTVFEGDREVKQLTKTNQVNDFLRDLLQMDGKQFAQIVLLPQGQFRRFLVAPSDDKAAVLEQLFHTQLFGQWAGALNARLKKDREQNQATLTDLHRLQGELTWDAENQSTATDLLAAQKTDELLALMATQQTTTKAAQQRADADYDQATHQEQALTRQDTREEQLLRDRTALAQAQQDQTALTAQAPTMLALERTIVELEWTQELQPKWQAWQHAEQVGQQRQTALHQAQDQQRDREQAWKAAQATQAGLAAVQTEIAAKQKQQAQNERVRPIYEQVAATQAQLSQAHQAVQTATNRTAACQTLVDQNQAEQTAQQTIIAQQGTLYETSQRLAATLTQLTGWQAQANDLQVQRERAQELTQRIGQLTDQVAVATQAADQAQAEADDRYQARLRHQIAELSAQLTPGSPCPVCGATDHPTPAATAVAGADVSAEAVQTAQTQATQQRTAATQLAAQLDQLRAQQVTDQHAEQTAWEDLQKALAPQATAELTAVRQYLNTTIAETQAAVTANRDQLAAVKAAEQRLATLTAQATTLETDLQAAQTAVQTAQTTSDRLATQLSTQQGQLLDTAPTLADFTAQEQALATELTALQTRWQTAEDQVGATQQALTIAQTNLKNAQRELTQSQDNLAQATATVTAYLAAHELTLPEDRQQIEERLAAVSTLTTKRTTLREYQTRCDRTATLVQELTTRIAGQPEPDRTATQAALKAAHELVATLQDRRYALQEQWRHNADLVTTLKQRLAGQQTALQRTQELAELAGVLNGDGPNSKLGLERYVLQTYLRQILTVGNQRLQQLTNGRYQFVIDDAQASSKKRSGLEIDVYDDHVGEQRSVHTLSGGESFIAALALALALGEVIQRTTGSVDIDALFIDEGFGSLDEEALMTALESLESVEGRHRMIGIISHVSELRSQVPNQLQVVSDGNGESHVHYQLIAD